MSPDTLQCAHGRQTGVQLALAAEVSRCCRAHLALCLVAGEVSGFLLGIGEADCRIHDFVGGAAAAAPDRCAHGSAPLQ